MILRTFCSTFATVSFGIDDTDLMPAFHQGYPAAYEAVFRHFHRSIRFFTEELVKDIHVAEDITADTFSKAFKKNKDFASLEKLKSFLFTTAKYAALDFLKMQGRHEKVHQQIRYLADKAMDDVELAYIRAEVIKSVYAAIETLPEKPRQVISMAFIEGKKLPEIAEALNISYNTVQNYRGRGLELLRIQLIKNNLLSGPALWLALSLLNR